MTLPEHYKEIDAATFFNDKIAGALHAYFSTAGYSLHDALSLTHNDLLQIPSVGATKVREFEKLKEDLLNPSDASPVTFDAEPTLTFSEPVLTAMAAIKDEEHLTHILPSKVANSLTIPGRSLLEILQLSDSKLRKIRGFGDGKIKVLNDFKAELQAADEKTVLERLAPPLASQHHTLPFNYSADDSLYTNLVRFFNDWIELELKQSGATGPRSFKVRNAYFGLRGEVCRTKQELAKFNNITVVRVEQLVKFSWAPFLTVGKIDNYSMREELRHELNDTLNRYRYTSGFVDALCEEVQHSETQIKRLLECFDYALPELNGNLILTYKKEAKTLERICDAVDFILKRCVEPVSQENLLQKIIERLEYMEERRNVAKGRRNKEIEIEHVVLESAIHCCDAIVSVEEGVTYYSYPWSRLHSIQTRVGRIAYESELPAMSEAMLLEAYNELCEQHEMNDLKLAQLHISAGTPLISLGNKYFSYRSESSDAPQAKRQSPQEVVERFILQQGGTSTFDAVASHLRALNYHLSDGSIKSYISNCARTSIQDSNVCVHDSMVLQNSDTSVRPKVQKGIGKVIAQSLLDRAAAAPKGIPIDELARLTFQECIDAGFRLRSKQRITSYIESLINASALQEEDGVIYPGDEQFNVDDLWQRKTPEYYAVIENQAIQYLKETGNAPVRLNKLWRLLRTYYPENQTMGPFYKIFRLSQHFDKITIDGVSHLKLRDHEVMVPVVDSPRPTAMEGHFDINRNRILIATRPVVFDWQKLTEFVSGELIEKHRITTDIIRVGMDRLHNLIRTETGYHVWGLNAFKPLYKLYTQECDEYDLQSCAFLLAISYETFLNRMINVQAQNGLMEKIKSDPRLDEVRRYRNHTRFMDRWAVDNQLLRRSQDLNALIYFRNRFTHDAADVSLDFGHPDDYIKLINQFMATYIYTAYVLKP